MGYKFDAIESDKKNLDFHNSEKVKRPNSFFAGISGIGDINKNIVQKNTEKNGIQNIKLDLIKERSVNNFDKISNTTLKTSIRTIGLLNPILVRTTDNGKYIVISGHRRLNAIKELVSDLKVELATIEKNGGSAKETNEQLNSYQTIPAIVFTVVEEDSELLGTDPKYITKEIEEKMYQAANLETRPISSESIVKNIQYFYNLIMDNKEYELELLNERNKTAERKATKLNKSAAIADIITNDLKFPISRSAVTQAIIVIEGHDKYPAYHKICMKRLIEKGNIKSIYKDFDMACKVKNADHETKDIEKEYLDRMEKSEEPMVDIYNECFNIRPAKEKGQGREKKIAVTEVRSILYQIKDKKISIDEAIKMLSKIK